MKWKFHLAVALLVLSLAASEEAPAMPIHTFVRLNDDDASTLVTLLVEGAAKHLRQQGHPDQAAKVIALFKNPGKDGGVNQFAMNLKMIDGMNNRNAINPNNRVPVYEIEDAMERTLRDNGILVPASYFREIDNTFQPVGPPRNLAPTPSGIRST